MKLPLRWIGLFFGLLVIAGLVFIGWELKEITRWKNERIAMLAAQSNLAETSHGPVEFAEAGNKSGIPLLIVHGELGGFDQAMALGSSLTEKNFRVICPSRPGYLRTPLASGLLFQQQADALVALMDHLQIDQFSVLAFGGGAPVALHLGIKYPERVRAIGLFSGVVRPVPDRGATLPGRKMLNALTGDVGSWLFYRVAQNEPALAIEWLLSFTTDIAKGKTPELQRVVLDSPQRLEWMRAFVGAMVPVSPRETGTRNDLLQLAAMTPLNWKSWKPPLFACYGALSSDDAMSEAEYLKTQVPAAAVQIYDQAGYLLELGPESQELLEQMAEFLATPRP